MNEICSIFPSQSMSVSHPYFAVLQWWSVGREDRRARREKAILILTFLSFHSSLLFASLSSILPSRKVHFSLPIAVLRGQGPDGRSWPNSHHLRDSVMASVGRWAKAPKGGVEASDLIRERLMCQPSTEFLVSAVETRSRPRAKRLRKRKSRGIEHSWMMSSYGSV